MSNEAFSALKSAMNRPTQFGKWNGRAIWSWLVDNFYPDAVNECLPNHERDLREAVAIVEAYARLKSVTLPRKKVARVQEIDPKTKKVTEHETVTDLTPAERCERLPDSLAADFVRHFKGLPAFIERYEITRDCPATRVLIDREGVDYVNRLHQRVNEVREGLAS